MQLFEKTQSFLEMKNEIKIKYSVENLNPSLYNAFMVDEIFEFGLDGCKN